MRRCPLCSAELPVSHRFCGYCGAPVETNAEFTVTASRGAAARLKRLSSREEGRFHAGTVLLQRYRIADRIGHGGMGEVYKATDLLIGQMVALKFLLHSADSDISSMERLRDEVRVARQVSHPNVCRVYDLGEAEGELFLSMEYVDGEDLASLLRRIGRVPQDKALDIARKLCAGLAAAHDRGLVHRDLKPSNVMLDGHGNVRLMDFGLAAVPELLRDAHSGTPAYMAPEQRDGGAVTTRSDIYALGVVLHELFTGKRPEEPTSQNLDPAIARVIDLCLNQDPAKRPATALDVAAILPGGDPLAAALAAGETPDPDVVAAAGGNKAMRPALAMACFGLLAAGCAIVAWLAGRASFLSVTNNETPPAFMAQQARDIVARLGYTEKPADSSWSYAASSGVLTELRKLPADMARRRAENPRPPLVYFWYRTSPEAMLPRSSAKRNLEFDPPLSLPGMVNVRLDTHGRLFWLSATPAQDRTADSSPSYDWKPIFDAAGLDPAGFSSVSPVWTPSSAFDTSAAWLELDSPDPLRLEAAAWLGRPVFFRMERTSNLRITNARGSVESLPATALAGVLAIALGCFFAWRNFRLGRVHETGAIRLASVIFAADLLAWALFSNHSLDSLEYTRFFRAAANALLIGGVALVLYYSVEPYVRRRWPDALIGWTRLLNGGFRDVIVGRDVLIGLTAGAWAIAGRLLHDLRYGLGSPMLASVYLARSQDVSSIAAGILLDVVSAAVGAGALLVLFLLFMRTLRSRTIATIAFVAMFAAMLAADSAQPILTVMFTAPVVSAIAVLLLLRYGLLAFACLLFVGQVTLRFPMTLDSSAWFFPSTVGIIAVILALGAWAMRAAVGKQRLWSEEF